jgi:flavin-dependent dehydrogenase
MTKSIVIVGGGTAGWMTAAYLKVTFGDSLSITLVESANVPTIGVGEATFSTVRRYFQHLGLDEREWMPECDATYKLAIRFEDWRADGHYFYHPFERPRVVEGFSLADWWLHARPSDRFDQDTAVLAALCDNLRSPRYLDGTMLERDFVVPNQDRLSRAGFEGDTQFPYAFHFDAAKLAGYLTGFGVRRGVEHVLDDVVEVVQDDRGAIDGIRTREHGLISGDLFVDCTGFKALLLNKALGVPFQSYQQYLPNDSAVALRVPTDMAANGIRPCTTATAREAGWIWTIPLYRRVGTGYVYSSEYCGPDEAEQSLRRFVGARAEGVEANHIRMRIGRSESSWVKNCVAIGLSSGFVEPLESTGIFFIQNAIEQLVKHFPAGEDDDLLREAYNQQVAHVMDGVRDFLVLHYYAAARQDNQYWKDAKTRPLPDSLAERIELWKVKLPDESTVFPYFHGFEPYSYAVMLLGLGGLPVRPLPALANLDASAARKEFELVREQGQILVDRLPSQYEYFAHLHGPGSDEAAHPALVR